ncbi:MAG: fibronectin type III domain-containing protein [Bacteroidetes bacterium]|nr:fibronectin type III domain-containing protein [Bacteroidota bacterium]MBP6401349.1 fibronectin type III domain-containing protein [Bacteroidia bacterium]
MRRLLLILSFSFLAAQLSAQVSTISPDFEFQGNTLTTTITMASGTMTSASPPMSSTDIYLEQNGVQIYTDFFNTSQVYTDGFGGLTDSLYTDFTIPALAQPGWYDVHVITYTMLPFPPFTPVPSDNVLTSGFLVRIPGSCSVPTGVNAGNITNTTTDISWDIQTADTFRIRYTIDGTTNYLYKDINGTGSPIVSTLTGLFPGTTYSVEMATRCTGIPSTYSLPITFTTDFTPTNCVIPGQLDVTNITNTTADFSWTPFILADTFRIRYAEDGTSNYIYMDSDGSMGSLVSLSNLNPGMTYQIQVSSICTGISSGYSVPFIFTTDVTPVPCIRPYGLTVPAFTNTTAQIDWTPYVTADTFRIRYTPFGFSNYRYIDVNGGFGNSYNITGLNPATTYSIQVGAICNGSRVGYSPAIQFTTDNTPANCVKPFGLSQSNTANTSVTVSWSPYVAADTFRVRYHEWNSLVFEYKDVNGTGGIVSTNLTGLNPNTLYYYQVASICSGVSSGYSAVSSFTTLSITIACIRPYGLSESNITNSSALVAWDNFVSADTFRIRYAVNGTTNYQYIDQPGLAGNSVVISGLLPSTTYDYRISSICTGSSSGYSRSSSFTTSSGAVACGIPYGLSNLPLNNTSATVSWTPLVTADSFLVRYSVFGTTNYLWKKILGTPGVTSTTLTGLTPNTLYQWQVRPICNGVPAGPYSVSNTITIPPSPIRMSSSVLNDQFTVYPNPATDLVNIRFESTENSKIKIQLIDLTGRILNSREFTAVNGENLFSLPLTGLSKGIYTIIVENGDVKRQSRISVD